MVRLASHFLFDDFVRQDGVNRVIATGSPGQRPDTVEEFCRHASDPRAETGRATLICRLSTPKSPRYEGSEIFPRMRLEKAPDGPLGCSAGDHVPKHHPVITDWWRQREISPRVHPKGDLRGRQGVHIVSAVSWPFSTSESLLVGICSPPKSAKLSAYSPNKWGDPKCDGWLTARSRCPKPWARPTD